jgi:hypothetical protein
MGSPKAGSKYQALYRHLQRQPNVEVELTFARIEALLGEPLPPSARTGRAFWSNRQAGLQATAWLAAGYRVSRVDLAGRRIVFRRRGAVSGSGSRARSTRWDAERVRALREHLGMNQAELADVLGVRQQTISEWESGLYHPTRARSKHLDLVAERASFPYLAAVRKGGG